MTLTGPMLDAERSRTRPRLAAAGLPHRTGPHADLGAVALCPKAPPAPATDPRRRRRIATPFRDRHVAANRIAGTTFTFLRLAWCAPGDTLLQNETAPGRRFHDHSRACARRNAWPLPVRLRARARATPPPAPNTLRSATRTTPARQVYGEWCASCHDNTEQSGAPVAGGDPHAQPRNGQVRARTRLYEPAVEERSEGRARTAHRLAAAAPKAPMTTGSSRRAARSSCGR